ncbi:hypothetical protein GGR52DRAFT_585847 [Hypoxylon sp. FL1284]|nr:hypothetical protein GGR52DRAFT_585847 [Hypoxylon sp. FL1284]
MQSAFYSATEDVERSFPDAEMDFVQTGPSPSTESIIRRAVGRAHQTFLPSLQPADEWKPLASSLGASSQRNHVVKWREVHDEWSTKFLSPVPTCPSNPSQYFVDFRVLHLDIVQTNTRWGESS